LWFIVLFLLFFFRGVGNSFTGIGLKPLPVIPVNPTITGRQHLGCTAGFVQHLAAKSRVFWLNIDDLKSKMLVATLYAVSGEVFTVNRENFS
jgi:hypothetical protein